MAKHPRSVNYFLIFYLIFYLCLSFFGSVFMTQQLVMICIQLLPVVLGLIYLLLTRQPLCSSIRLQRFHPATIPLVILFTYSLWPSIICVNALSMTFSKNVISETVNSTLAESGFLASIVLMAVIPALVEEITFRGILYGQYRCKRPIKGILLSALCFGLMHMNFNQFCYAFFLGICLSLLVEATGSLIPAMLMHFTFNATSVGLVFLEQTLSNLKPAIETETQNATDLLSSVQVLLPVAATGLFFAALLYLVMARINHRDKEILSWFHIRDYAARPKQKVTNIAFYCFVVICLIMCVLMQFAS